MEELITLTSEDITAGMVTVRYEEPDQLAFAAWMDIRIRRFQELENQLTESSDSSFLSQPRMIESIAVDEELLVRRDSAPSDVSNASLTGFEDF